MSLHLRNPHSVLAILKSRPKDVLQISPSRGSGAWDQVVELAKKNGIPLGRTTDRSTERSSGGHVGAGGREGGAEAVVREKSGISAEELFADADQRANGRGVWLALDSLQDPQNVGAIFRTAAFFGVQGILLTEERSAPLSATVYDVASGGVESMPFTLQTNLQRGFEIAKAAGLWILGTSEHAGDSLSAIEADRPWLVVLGNEERGMRRLTEESCDLLCKIPPQGTTVTSLNVSVAAGIVISRLTGARAND